MHDNEKKLVEEAKKDPKAFAGLYDMFFDQIYRYVRRRVHDENVVEDIVSQTFFDALNHIKDFEWRGFPFSSWLYKIAHNNVLKWYRVQGRLKTVDIDQGRGVVDVHSDSVDGVLREEKKELVLRVLDKLSFEEREILRLKFFEEVSNVEIAEIMGLSANHIGVKIFRVLKKVKQLLSNQI